MKATKFEIYADKSGLFRWRCVRANGRVIADGGGGYTRRRDARRAVMDLVSDCRGSVRVVDRVK